MSRTVTVIPQKINPVTKMTFESNAKRRVAGYARVSTDSEEQQTSYEAQVDYYTRYIRSKPEWEFVNVYTDEGISATNTKKREGFNQMVRDALDGKIDLIVTKSVSRFARNTVDTLTTVRKLKDNGSVNTAKNMENPWQAKLYKKKWAKKFVDMLTTNCHGAMLEHGTVYLKYEAELVRGIQECDTKFSKYKNNKFVNTYNGEEIDFDSGFAIKRFEKKNSVSVIHYISESGIKEINII